MDAPEYGTGTAAPPDTVVVRLKEYTPTAVPRVVPTTPPVLYLICKDKG